jgi:DNA-binding transcriptional regulator/RsmH inhibitor MraZ
VLTEDVQVILRRVVRPDQEDEGDSVATIAEKADTSTRTVYRVLAGTTKTLSLDLADRLCIAADAHLSECRLSWPDGRVEPYLS